MRQLNYGAADVGMVVVAPAASSFHHDADPGFPLLSAGPSYALDHDAAKSSGAPASSAIQFWQQSPPPPGGSPNPSPFAYLKKPLPMLDGGGGSSGVGVATCQDCGNQAKKDCSHNRCRTCCKSRGLDCSTHVRSTWVPAARRRERQHLAGSGSASSSPATASTPAVVAASTPKKPRLVTSQTTTSHTSTSNATTPRSFDTTSSRQDASFRDTLPRQVRAPALFRCVRVTSIDDGEDEYAYQATVTINGHVFKGFLYDQGVDDDPTAGGVPNMSELNLGGGPAGGSSGVREGGLSMAPTDLYGAAGGGQDMNYGSSMS